MGSAGHGLAWSYFLGDEILGEVADDRVSDILQSVLSPERSRSGAVGLDLEQLGRFSPYLADGTSGVVLLLLVLERLTGARSFGLDAKRLLSGLDELPLAQVGLVSGWAGIRVLDEAPSSTEDGATLEPFFSPDWGMAFGEQNFRPCDSLGGGLAGVLLACTPGHPIEKLGLVGIIPSLRNRALVSASRSLAVVQSVARQVDA